MSWRKHDNHRAETKAVKQALKKAGINAKVGHGKGTAWGWLEINLGEQPKDGHKLLPDAPEDVKESSRFMGGRYCVAGCQACERRGDRRSKALQIAQVVTGRSGEYSGNILILEQ